MYTAVQASSRQKHLPLNTYVSLYSRYTEDDEAGKEGGELLGTLPGQKDLNPEELVLEQERVDWIAEIIDSQLSSFEKQVLDLHITGMGYTEIAKVLGKDDKSADNALQRIRSKLRRALLEERK
jgi:RNA polymerase sporulation-specific sigma factor